MESHQQGHATSGCTAAVCLIRNESDPASPQQQRRMLYTANVGDTRIVLCENQKPMRMTYDHKANDKSEQNRIEEVGGFMLRNRVMGILAVSRSFGDHALKGYVSADPYTSAVRLGPASTNPFFIAACDGVWDVLEDQEAVDLVLAAMQRGKEKSAAALLVQEALDRGSTDNVTCEVIFL